MITRIFHRLRCVLFLHEVLSADSIWAGVHSQDAIIIAQKVTYFCWRQVICHDGPIEDYFRQSWHNFSYLLLGGIGLTEGCPHKGTYPCDIDLTVVRDWVVDELMFIGREESVTALRSYWENGGIHELVQILEFTQFPRPMEGVQV